MVLSVFFSSLFKCRVNHSKGFFKKTKIACSQFYICCFPKYPEGAIFLLKIDKVCSFVPFKCMVVLESSWTGLAVTVQLDKYTWDAEGHYFQAC